MLRLCFLLFLISIVGCGQEQELVPLPDLGGSMAKGVKAFGSPKLFSYSTCDRLANDLKSSALDEMHTRMAIILTKGPSGGFVEDASGGALPTAAMPEAAPVEGVDFSGTNNQEKGIDEADIIKLDGNYFYILNKSTLEIVSVTNPGELAHAGTLSLETPGKSLLLADDLAVVLAQDAFTKISSLDSAPSSSLTHPRYTNNNLRLDIIDLSADRKSPQLMDSLYVQGELVAARKVGENIHLATFLNAKVPNLDYWPRLNRSSADEVTRKLDWIQAVSDITAKNEEIIENFDFLSLLPSTLVKDDRSFTRNEVTSEDCGNTFATSEGTATGFVTLVTLKPSTDETTLDIQRVRSNNPVVYASNSQLILASPEHEPWWFYNNEELKDQTSIHRFDLSEDAPPTYADSAQIPGTLHNSFSLSEHEGYLRAATTTKPRERSWFSPSTSIDIKLPEDENHLFILGDDLGDFGIISSIEGIAPGERIWSARFSKDKGFLVTFKQVDPLFTLDLSDPSSPKVAGELKVPGVSNYLQDIGSDQLLAVGYGGDNDGLDFQTTISLFDTSDFSNPQLADTLSFAIEENLNNSWSRVSSEANNNHLAINYFGPVEMTAIPLTTDRFVENPLDPYNGEWEYISKLTLVKTKAGEELSVHGSVDHSEFYNKESSNQRRSPQIRRSYFIGDHIYAISSKAITANELSTMTSTGSYELP